MKTVPQKKRTHSNRLGIGGWFYGGKFGVERYIFALHRLAGLGILLYFIIHIFITGQKIHGKEAWDAAMSSVSGPWFHIGEYLVFAAIAFHGLNGIRLILAEFGLVLGKPKRPVYPYTTVNIRIRVLTWSLMILAVILMFVGGYDFFLMH